MPEPVPLDDTNTDHEQFETEPLARDRDSARSSRADIDETTARDVVMDLVDAGTVTPVPEDRVLVHEPTRTAFDSIIQLAVFHRGWTAAHEADEEEA